MFLVMLFKALKLVALWKKRRHPETCHYFSAGRCFEIVSRHAWQRGGGGRRPHATDGHENGSAV
ncbi:hypothetical protein RAA17_01030 [Komagataeibacter rhaeticus]|nr:hypothetical protein [Komagataeibacter rhaeticus]